MGSHKSESTPIINALKRRCPNCGEGKLFKSLLSYQPSCQSCGTDLGLRDIGDGVIYIVTFLNSILIPIGAIIYEIKYAPPLWMHVIIWSLGTVIASFLLLLILKPLYIGIMMRYEQRND